MPTSFWLNFMPASLLRINDGLPASAAVSTLKEVSLFASFLLACSAVVPTPSTPAMANENSPAFMPRPLSVLLTLNLTPDVTKEPDAS